ncbi:HET-domain-containing protein [Hypoxylon cercidicola]|nr:HET-domain-containing protein [Hypoxylon cercidicola]
MNVIQIISTFTSRGTLYEDLPLPPQGYIRLAKIYPGNLQDEIIVHLSIADFSQDRTLPYEALSYVWGSNDNPEFIRIMADGGKSSILSITRNLATALRHLRKADMPRIIWIDALCIDQSNGTEKSQQVERMGEIYKMAKRVIAFLGPEENDSTRGMDLMRYIGSQVEIDWTCNNIKSAGHADDTRFGDDTSVLPLTPTDLYAIYHILCRSWFERLWIRQEIFLAGTEAIIQCGTMETNWLEFRRALACVATKLYVQFQYSHSLHKRTRFLRGFIWQSARVSFWDLHEVFGNASCSDPRDRVFAVRALLYPSENEICPVPDYSKPWVEVYKDVALRFIDKFGSLDILRECQFDPHASSPSWVPNWSKKRTATGLRQCPLMASSQLNAHYEVPGDGILRVAGVISTVINELQVIPDLSDAWGGKIYEVYRQILMSRDTNCQQSLFDDLLEAYARTLVCGRIADGVDPSRAFPSLEASKGVVALANSGAQFDLAFFKPGSDEDKFLGLSTIIGGTQFGRCADRSIGIVPLAARPGDMICVLMGCRSPMLLRPTANGEFLLIGEAYIHGLCQGEALLGPLPENVRLVKAYQNASVGYALGFVDSISGRVFFEDPRLEKLPTDLSAFRELINQNGNSNLQVHPDVLRDIGVSIRYFDLV